jgi:hypothetical protein
MICAYGRSTISSGSSGSSFALPDPSFLLICCDNSFISLVVRVCLGVWKMGVVKLLD